MRILVLIVLLLLAGCISEKPTGAADRSDMVLENGDFVKMDYIGWVKDTGEVFDTTYEDVAFNTTIKKMDRFTFATRYEPIEFTLGQGQVLPALEKDLIGLKIGETKNITLTPEEGYGEWSSNYTTTLPVVAILTKLTEVPISEFRANMGKEPEKNETIQLNYWTARVVDISNSTVTLQHEPKEGTIISTQYGPATVTLNDTHIITHLTPKLGTIIATAFGEQGIISKINNTDFTIDFNHPLAGKTLLFEVNITDIVKADELLKQKIVWSDYETGIEMAKKEKQPAVIFIYLEDCQACEALDNITFSNPEVTELRDKVIWIKVDASESSEIAAKYRVTSYPAIILLNENKKTSKKIDGYIPPDDLRKELDTLITD